MCNECTTEGPQRPIQDIALAKAAVAPGRIYNGDAVAREKAAIDGILDQQDVSLNVLNDLADDLFNKFMPVLAQDDAINEKNPVDQPYYGSSQVFRRIQDQYNRTNNIAEKLRLLRRVAEV